MSSADPPTLQVITPRRPERVQSDALGHWSALSHCIGDLPMRKLLDAYKADPSLANAKRVFLYDWKHAFASVLLSPADQALLQHIIARHNKGE